MSAPVRSSCEHRLAGSWRRSCGRGGAKRLVQRARIVLLAARGQRIAAIARALGCRENTVRKWQERSRARPKLASLQDDDRTGRPPSVPMFVRLQLMKLACKRPADCKLPFRSVWTLDTLRTALVRATRFVSSKTEIRRIWIIPMERAGRALNDGTTTAG